MPTDRSRTAYPAFLVPDPDWLASNLASDSSYSAFGAVPGVPEPAGDYDFALTAHGDQAVGGDLTVIVQAGGIVGRSGASFLWKNTADSAYYGWDAPTVLTGWAPVVWATTPDVGQPCIVTLYSGDALAVWAAGASLNTIGYTTVGGSPGTIALLGGATGANGCAPCLVQLPPTAETPLGRLLLFAWVVDGGIGAQTVQMQFSDDDGATWALGSTGVLPETVSTDATTGYVVVRTRAAYANGQILLMVGLQYNDTALYPGAADPNKAYRNEVRQYASSDGGHTFTQVWASDITLVGTSHYWEDASSQNGGGYPDVVAHNGTFYVAWISLIDLMPYVFRLESAFQSMGTTTGVAASTSEVWGTLDGTGAYFTQGDCVLAVDETGVLYITGRCPTDQQRWVINHSTDYSATWPPMARSSMAGGGGLWWDAESSGTYPQDAAGCWHRGRLLVLAGHGSTSSYDGGSLSLFILGGYTTITMPGYDRWRIDSRQVTWGQTWLPLDLPSDSGWTRTRTGTPTESLSSGLLSLSVGALQALKYSVVPGGTVAGGVGACWSATSDSGSYRVRLRSADGTNGYQITVSLTTTTLTVIDGTSTATLGTAAATGDVEVLAWITAGVASVWYRVITDPLSATRAWTRLVDSAALADNGATWGANLIEWADYPLGNASSGTWRHFYWVDDDSLGYSGTGLGSASIPQDLLGRRFAGVPTDLDGSTSISANGGPAWAGQSWRIRTAYEYGPDKLHPEISPSPQIGARFAQDTNTSLIWDLHTSSTGLEGRPLAIAILGCNFHNAILYGYNGGWVNIAAIDNTVIASAGYNRTGRIVVIPSGGTLTYVVAGQLVGASIDLGGGKVRRIAANGEGQLGGNSSVVAWLRLEGVDDTEATIGTCTIYAPNVVTILAQPSSYSRFKLYWSACTTPEGYIKAGKVLLGSLRILPRRPSAGRSTDFTPQYETDRPKGGVRSFFRAGKTIRRARLPFSDLLPSSDLYATAKAPGYAKLSTAGSAVASHHGTALSVLGMVEELGGSPCVYLSRVPQTNTNTGPITITDPSVILYGRILDDLSLGVSRGHEGQDASFTLGGLTVEEEP